MTLNPETLSVKEAGKMMGRGELSSVSLVESCLAKIKEKDGEVRAFVEVYEDALEQAKEALKVRAAKLQQEQKQW